MQNLIDAAVAAASRNGVQAAVVLIGSSADSNGHGVHVPAPGNDQELTALRTQLDAANTALAQERHALQAANANLQAANSALHQAEGQAAGPAATHLQQQLQGAQGRITELEQQLAGIAAAGTSEQPMQSDALARIAELEQALATAQAAPQAAPAPGTGEQPAEVQSFDSYGIEHLGLEPACEKLVRKKFDTIGALRTGFEALDTEDKTKAFASENRLKKDYLVAIGVALLGKAPSATPRPSSGSAPAQGTGGAPDVPEGHADRTWTERLAAARAREKRMREVTATLEELRAKAQKEHADAFTQDEGETEASLKLDKLPKEAREEIQVEENTYNVVRGQMIACCWTCNLRPPQEDTDITTIDASLVAAGLGHLAESKTPAAA